MTEDDLSAARRRHPRGTRLRGTITGFPAGVGRAGMVVDLDDPVPGWVDMLLLPDLPEFWPAVGRAGYFEVLQHRGDEIRLFPLDAGMRGSRCRQLRWSGPEWAAISRQWPVGSVLDAVVESVYPGNREYSVRIGDWYELVEYENKPPVPGDTVQVSVERQSEWTHSLVLRPL